MCGPWLTRAVERAAQDMLLALGTAVATCNTNNNCSHIITSALVPVCKLMNFPCAKHHRACFDLNRISRSVEVSNLLESSICKFVMLKSAVFVALQSTIWKCLRKPGQTRLLNQHPRVQLKFLTASMQRKHQRTGICLGTFKQLVDRATLKRVEGFEKLLSVPSFDRPYVRKSYCGDCG